MTTSFRVALTALGMATVAGCAPDAAEGLPPATAGCAPPSAHAPENVYCTGLYAVRDPSKHAAAAQPYKPGVVLWSDGADKSRFLMIPDGETIDTSDFDHWVFPVGTKAFKEFRLDGKLVETRMLWKQAEKNWVTTTYVWDEAGKAASRNHALKGTIRPDGYEIPSDKDCGRCHHGGSDYLLGVEAVALALPGAEGLNLEELAAQGLLSHPPSDTHATLPEDDTALAGPALGFLHANCGMACHSTRGLGEETQLVLRLRADEVWDASGHAKPIAATATDTYLATVGQPPTTASVAQAFPEALRITAGQHDESLLWLLSDRRGDYQMPPIASHRVDDTGNAALADWIDAMTPAEPAPESPPESPPGP